MLCRFDITGQLAALQAKVSDGLNPDDTGLGKSTLRYLKESQRVGPLYRENTGIHMRNKLIACADSAHNPTNPAVARAGGLILLNGAPIDAKSNRTDDSADSPGATETTGLHIFSRRVGAHRERAEEMGIPQVGPTPIFDDSTTTIHQVAKGSKMSSHILARIALVKGAVDRGEIVIKGIPGTENPADLLTKVCFKSGVFQYLLKRMGLWICEMYYRTEWPRLKAPDKLLSRLPTGTKIAYVQLQSRLPLVSTTLPLMLAIQDLWLDTMGWLALWLVSPLDRL